MARILSIGPDHHILAARNRELRAAGHLVRGAATRALALKLVRTESFDLILLCDQFLPAYASELADELHNVMPESATLVLAGRTAPFSVLEIESALSNRRAALRAA